MEALKKIATAAARVSKAVATGEAWHAAWVAFKPIGWPLVASAIAGWQAMTEGLSWSIVLTLATAMFASVLFILSQFRQTPGTHAAIRLGVDSNNQKIATSDLGNEPEAKPHENTLDEIQERLAVAEELLQKHEKGFEISGLIFDVATKSIPDLNAKLLKLQDRINAVDERTGNWPQASGKMQEAFDAIRFGLDTIAKVQQARAVEIKIDRLFACIPTLPKLVDLKDRGELMAHLETAEAYIQRVEERSEEWWPLGPSPYGGHMAQAVRIAEEELDDLSEMNITSVEVRAAPPSLKRRYMEVIKKIEHTFHYLEARQSTAKIIQTDSPEYVYQVLSRITIKESIGLMDQL